MSKLATSLGQGVAYRTEAELIQTVLDQLEKFLPFTGDYAAFQEVPIGAGIVDVMIGAAHTAQLATRITDQKLATRRIKGIEAVVLASLYDRKPLKLETITRRCHLESKKVQTSLNRLLNWGFCFQPTVRTYLRAPAANQFASLISIEGKLQNWKKALEQAARNRLFSSYSYVVIDAKKARPAVKQIDRFKQSGVGLAIAAANERTVTIIYRPPRSSGPISDIYAILAKEELTTCIVAGKARLTEGLQNVLSAITSRTSGAIPCL